MMSWISATAIAAPDRDRGAGDLAQDAVVVRNNSIHLGAGAAGTGVALGGEGDGHVVASNAVLYLGASGSFDCFSATKPVMGKLVHLFHPSQMIVRVTCLGPDSFGPGVSVRIRIATSPPSRATPRSLLKQTRWTLVTVIC